VLENCDYFNVQSNFWNDLLFKTIQWKENPDNNTISISGLEYVYTPFWTNRTHHWHSCESPLIEQIGTLNIANAINYQTVTLPEILSVRSVVTQNATHAQKATIITITYGYTLTIQSATISQTASVPTAETNFSGSIPEVIPFGSVHLMGVTSPIITEI